MREPVSADRIREFARALAGHTKAEVRIYLTGGATAVLRGWRVTTVDIDLKIIPDSDSILRALPASPLDEALFDRGPDIAEVLAVAAPISRDRPQGLSPGGRSELR